MDKIILTEQSNQSTVDIDISCTDKIVELINNEDKKVAFAVENEKINIAKAIDLISDKLANGGHLLYFGAGTSGRLGVLDASECPPTFGVDSNLVRGYIAGGDMALRKAIEGAEDDGDTALIDYQNANVLPDDVVVGISASGNPKWLVGIMTMAKNNNISTIGLTCNPDAKIKSLSDIFICPVVGQEAITGSSRLKAGTAQKLVLNMLTTGSMIKIGKTYRNFMVDVKPTNDKLKDRAARIVAEITSITKDEAIDFLEKSNFEVKTAVVAIKKSVSPNKAREILKLNNGILRKII